MLLVLLLLRIYIQYIFIHTKPKKVGKSLGLGGTLCVAKKTEVGPNPPFMLQPPPPLPQQAATVMHTGSYWVGDDYVFEV